MCYRALAGVGLLVLSSLALADSTPLDETAEPRDRPRIGLVLGGGGARGGAHVGVLSVLEEMRIPIDCIAGTSMGALVGATYAVGSSAAQIERQMLEIDWSATLGSAGRRSQLPMQRKLAGITYSNNIELGISDGRLRGVGGLVSTQKMEGLFRLLVGDARAVEDFDELAIPFRAVATDLAAGEMVIIGSGDLTRAMRASMAVPGVFAPVVVGEAVLADGGMIRNLPVDIARDLCADVVIAVSLETPQPTSEELHSMFALAGRSIDAMIMANERLQLATLTERDVRITVPTEDLGSAQFERVPETIPLGVASARAVAASLARYSVSEAEYRAWRASLDKPDKAPVQVEAIQFRPLRHASAEYLATRLRTRPGEEVSRATLESDMNRIFSSGDFDRIDYRLLPGAGDGSIVEIDAVERYGGTDFIRFDLGLAGSSGGDVLYVIRADHRREWVNTLGGQWRNALQLGSLSEVTTAFYQPLDVAQQFFIEPGIAVRRSLENFFDDGRRVARYDLLEAMLKLDVGFNPSNHTRLTAGLRWGVTEFDEDIGRIEVFDLDRRRDANMVFAALYDTRDAAFLPTSGTFAKVEFTSSGSWLGGEQSYDVVEAVASQITEFGGSPLLLSAGAGRTIGGDLPRHRDFQLGGIRSLPPFAPGELRGEGYWAASASWALSLLEFQPVFQQSLYGALGLHAVRMTDRIDDIDAGVILGVSVTLSARTPIGPLLVSVGAADNDNVQLHFAIGRPIAEGSLLDRLH